MPIAKPLQLAVLSVGIAIALPAQAQDPAAGRKIAERQCARCHAIGPSDKSKLPIATPFRTIADRYSVWTLQEALAEGIVVGHAAMPEFVLNPDEISNLLSYMETLASKRKAK